MRYSLTGGLLRKAQTKITRLSVILALAILGLGAGLPLALSKTVIATSGAFPSTNDINRGNGWAHADQIGQTGHSITFKFTSSRAFASCFEYRSDGDTSQILTENSGNNYNPEVTDGLYPYVCVNNSTATKTIDASHYVEIRLAFGAEKDERFDWTKFNVPQPPAAPTGLRFTQGAKTLDCNYQGTNVLSSGTLHWTVPAGGIDQYVVTPSYPDNSGQYQFYPPGGSNSSAWVTNNFPTHGEGVYSWTIKAKGTNGLWSPAATCNVIYDTHSPTASFTQEPPRYAGGNFWVYGHASDNVRLKGLLFDIRDPHDTTGNSWRAGCVGGTLDISWTDASHKNATFKCQINAASSNLIDGQTYTLRVHASDFAGYGGGESRDLTIDRTPPIVTVSPVAGSLLHGTETFDITVTDDHVKPTDTVWVYLYNTLPPQKSSGASVLLTNGHGTFTANTKLLDDGKANLDIAKLYDLAGNASGTTDNYFRNYIVDNTRPTISFTNPTDFNNSSYNQYFQVGPNLAISASDANGIATTVLHVYNADGSPAKFCPVSYTDTTTCDTSGLSDGNYYVKAGATDNAGNKQTITKDFTIDSTRPNAHITSPSDNSYISAHDFTVTGTANDSLGGVDHVNVYIATNPWAAGGYVVNNQPASYNPTTGTFTYDAAGIADGAYTIKAVAYDKAGNAHFANTVHVTVDTTAPVVSITAPSDGDVVRGTVTISGTVTDANPDHYYLVIKDSGSHIVAGPHTVYAANVADYSWDTTNVADGTYTIDLEARDAAGNKDAGSTATVQVTVDNTAPVVTVDSLSTTDTTPTITGTVDDTNSTVTVTVNGLSYTAAIVSGNNWSADVTNALPTGVYDVQARATDTAGNTGADSTTNELTVAATLGIHISKPNNPPANPQGNVTSNGNQNLFTNNSFVALNSSGDTDGSNNANKDSNQDGGVVEGDQTGTSDSTNNDINFANTTNTKSSAGFLGLGWWWLLVIAAILGGLYWLVSRRAGSDQQA